jgi:thioredoxin 2
VTPPFGPTADAEHIVCPQCSAVNRVPSARLVDAARCGSCHGLLFTGHPIEVGEAEFERHVRANSIPVLRDVWAQWCGPCRSMGPQFERAAVALEPGLRLLKLNADTARDTCARLGVRGIPAMFLFHGGSVVARTEGAMNAGAIVGWVRDRLPVHALTEKQT